MAYTVAYFGYGLHWFGWIIVACMVLGAIAPFFALRGDLVASAHFATGSLFAGHRQHQLRPGRRHRRPATPGSTSSRWSPGCSAASAAWPSGARWPWRRRCDVLRRPRAGARHDGHPRERSRETQSIFDIVLIFVTVLLIIGTFLRTRTLAERETHVMFADLERAEGEARQADQAKSAFLATMSHEIRTPMNGVLGMADLLLEMPLGEQQRRFAEVIKSSGESLLSILNDILDYSKIEAGRMDIESTSFDLRTLVEQAVELIAARGQEQRLVFIVDIDPAVPSQVVGDPTRLRQVLMNLLGNAVKFTSKGEVEVDVEVHERTADRVSLAIAVRDTGVGIAPDAIERLFKPFSQADASIARQYGGTGLGLAISARIVELMGGRIGVDSTLGFGSTFRLQLDLACPAPAAKPAVAPPAALAGRRDPAGRSARPPPRRARPPPDGRRRRRGRLRRRAGGARRDHQRPGVAAVRRAPWWCGTRPATGCAWRRRLPRRTPSTRVVVLVESGAFVADDVLGAAAAGRAGVAARLVGRADRRHHRPAASRRRTARRRRPPPTPHSSSSSTTTSSTAGSRTISWRASATA